MTLAKCIPETETRNTVRSIPLDNSIYVLDLVSRIDLETSYQRFLSAICLLEIFPSYKERGSEPTGRLEMEMNLLQISQEP